MLRSADALAVWVTGIPSLTSGDQTVDHNAVSYPRLVA
jgi:hypothetical protein